MRKRPRSPRARIGWVLALAGAIGLLLAAAWALQGPAGSALAGSGPSEGGQRRAAATVGGVRVSDVDTGSAVVSWATDASTRGSVNYGTDRNVLGGSAADARGVTFAGTTHFVQLSSLAPNTTYYFDVVSVDPSTGSTVVDDNGGQHYSVRTASAPCAGATNFTAQALRAGDSQPIADALVYLRVNDVQGEGSLGTSAYQVAYTDASGQARFVVGPREAAGGCFGFSTSGEPPDEYWLEVRAGAAGATSGTVIGSASLSSLTVFLQGATPTPTPTVSRTPTPAGTPTRTSSPPVTLTPTVTPTFTASNTPTVTPTPTITPTPTGTPTLANTPTASVTPTPTVWPVGLVTGLRLTNLTDNSATLSWVTAITTTGAVRYGSSANQLDLLADDGRGPATADQIHYASIGGLEPATRYYYQLAVGSSTFDNRGVPFSFTTAPAAASGIPAPDPIYGTVYQTDWALASNVVVYLQLRDADGVPTAGSSAELSTLVTGADQGRWLITMPPLRSDLADWFSYSAAGDEVWLRFEGGASGSADLVLDTGAGRVVTTTRLMTDIVITRTLASGWNLISLPVSPTVPLKAADLLQLITNQAVPTGASGVFSATQVVKWENGAWVSHVAGLPPNNFPIELGKGYFVRAASYATWLARGKPIATPIPVPLGSGWNLIGVPVANPAYDADQLLQEVTLLADATQAVRWSNGAWQTHVRDFNLNRVFAIAPGEGYFIRAASPTTWTPRGP